MLLLLQLASLLENDVLTRIAQYMSQGWIKKSCYKAQPYYVRLRGSKAKKGFIRLVDVGSMLFFLKHRNANFRWSHLGTRRERAWTSCPIDRIEHVARYLFIKRSRYRREFLMIWD